MSGMFEDCIEFKEVSECSETSYVPVITNWTCAGVGWACTKKCRQCVSPAVLGRVLCCKGRFPQ